MSDPFDEDDDELENNAQALAIGRFARMIPQVPWFATVCQPLANDLIETAEAYAAALGFPDVSVAWISDWEDAEAAARSTDWNTEWWEAEEQLRVALADTALEHIAEDELSVALHHVSQQAAAVVQDAAAAAAARSGIDDEELILAATGAATQACYQAALVLATEADADHPFALKYKLFEAGRWPLGIVGHTLNLF